MRFNIFLIMSLLFLFEAEAQNNTSAPKQGFNLDVSIPTQKGQLLYLGQYWKNKTYAIDSVKLSNEGNGSFSRSERLPEGQYFLYIKPFFQVDLLIGNEQHDISIQLNENAPVENKVAGSKDTRLLWEYLAKTENFNKEITSLKISFADTTITDIQHTELLQQIKDWEEKQKNFDITFKKENKNTWAGKLLTGLDPIKLPYPQPKNQQELKENKTYGRNHFFDNIDLTDPRFWYTNYLDSYIDNYMKKWIDPVPDSLAIAASRLVEKTKRNDLCFKEMLSKLFNEASTSSIMGDENVWARLYEDYILDKNIPWISKSQYGELKSKYSLIKNNRIGMTARNMALQTLDSTEINTNSLPAEYLLLYFYDPSCGHCSTETPKLHDELYKIYKDKGLEIVAINIGSNSQEWANFVNAHKLTDWINATDLNYKSEYWMNYDVSDIPMAYLLDKDKRIIARKINTKQLKTILDFYLQNKNGTN